MKVIHKYQLNTDVTYLTLPKGAIILDVQVQHDVPVLWAIHDEGQMVYENRTFQFAATGFTFRYNDEAIRRYVGTVQFNEGYLVLHLFEMYTD